jgi:hypothetical protein
MSYKWKKYNREPKSGYTGISVGIHVYISANAMLKMNYPERMDIDYDVKKQAILLTVVNKGGYKISQGNKKEGNYPTGSLGVVLHKKMKVGRYHLAKDESTDEQFVFRY